MKNLKDPIVNRTRHLPACSAVPLSVEYVTESIGVTVPVVVLVMPHRVC
jgi:hypothetical protein